jgi:hypothetical protein
LPTSPSKELSCSSDFVQSKNEELCTVIDEGMLVTLFIG